MTRRERRLAARAAGISAQSPTRQRQTNRALKAILWTTAIVGVFGLIVVIALIASQGAQPRSVEVSELRAPSTTPDLKLSDGRSLGSNDSPVHLEIWSDFQCPACGQLARLVEPELIRTYVAAGILQITLRDAAFQGARAGAAYDESVEAAAAARCAADQRAFWPFHDWLFANQVGENQGAFRDERLRGIAIAAGLDVATWDVCRADGRQQAAVRTETEQALAMGVSATPTLILNGQAYIGVRTAEELGALIDAAAASGR